MASSETPMPFIKNLASSDRRIRTAALDSLRTFLSAKHIASSLQPLDILKLWKGLFYALWMCDRPLPQQALCSELADLTRALPRDSVVPWLRGFWATMAREWTAIDVLRMEKFLLLVRRVLATSLGWMQLHRAPHPAQAGKAPRRAAGSGAAARWDRRRVDEMLRLLEEWPLRPDDHLPSAPGDQPDEDEAFMPKTVPAGLKLHLLDIWIDEADKVGMLHENDSEEGLGRPSLQGKDVLERINALVDNLHSATLSTAVRIRSKESLADPRLPWNQQNHGKNDHALDEDDGDGWAGLDD